MFVTHSIFIWTWGLLKNIYLFDNITLKYIPKKILNYLSCSNYKDKDFWFTFWCIVVLFFQLGLPTGTKKLLLKVEAGNKNIFYMGAANLIKVDIAKLVVHPLLIQDIYQNLKKGGPKGGAGWEESQGGGDCVQFLLHFFFFNY